MISVELKHHPGDPVSLHCPTSSCGHRRRFSRSAHPQNARSRTRPARCPSASSQEGHHQGGCLWEQRCAIGLVEPILRGLLGKESMVGESCHQHPHAADVEDRIGPIHRLRKCLSSGLGGHRGFRHHHHELKLGIKREANNLDLAANDAGTHETADDACCGVLRMTVESCRHGQWIRRPSRRGSGHCQCCRGTHTSGHGNIRSHRDGQSIMAGNFDRDTSSEVRGVVGQPRSLPFAPDDQLRCRLDLHLDPSLERQRQRVKPGAKVGGTGGSACEHSPRLGARGGRVDEPSPT